MHNDTLRIFGVPMDLGANRRGVDMGPSAVPGPPDDQSSGYVQTPTGVCLQVG